MWLSWGIIIFLLVESSNCISFALVLLSFTINMKTNNIKTILWDWNGTLLNDIHHCIACMNIMLKQRSLELLSKDRYLKVFTFPVKEYYSQLGFDFNKEPFEIPAEEFIVHYNEGLQDVPLFNDAAPSLAFFKSLGIKQYIVSAMKHEALLQSVDDRGISGYFEKISGIKDNLAFGKNGIARKLIETEGIIAENTLFIGDTLHDAEVAAEMGINCVLISNGHQHLQRLKEKGNPVFSSLSSMTQWFSQKTSG